MHFSLQCIKYGQLGIVKYHSDKIQATNKNGVNAFCFASSGGHIDMVKFFALQDTQYTQGMDGLWYAIMNDNLESFE